MSDSFRHSTSPDEVSFAGRLVRLVVILSLLPLIGTIGFMLIEDWHPFDALYMSMITLTTVGYGEVHPLSTPGRTFVMIYLVVGLGLFLYCLSQVGEMVVRTEMRSWLERQRMGTAIKSMRDHFIVCGFGRMGRALCRALADDHLPFLVIDTDEKALASAAEEGWACQYGDVTDDRILIEAGIDRARGLATVLSSDADNLFVVMSARLISPKLQIIARASEESSGAKMRKAGANRVISIYHAGAMKMAHLLARPNLEDFFEVFSTKGGSLDLAEIHITTSGPYVGKSLEETDFSQRGVIIVGIRRANGELILPALRSTRIAANDRLIAMGRPEGIASISQS
ncbi:potassium channel protein [bacterium]|nr:potassium channel protein [bacterium]